MLGRAALSETDAENHDAELLGYRFGFSCHLHQGSDTTHHQA